MKLRLVLLGISLIILPPYVLGESHPNLFLQCHPSVTKNDGDNIQNETTSNLCREIPSIHWERCANHTLKKLSNNDSSWNNKPIRVTIAKDPNPNAFIANQQQIIITSGLISLISTGEELAFVIAHELAHALIDNCASRGPDHQINGYCEQIRTKSSSSSQTSGTNSLSHEIEADRIALMIMSAHDLDINHPASLLESIANYPSVKASQVPTEIGMRIASLKSVR